MKKMLLALLLGCGGSPEPVVEEVPLLQGDGSGEVVWEEAYGGLRVSQSGEPISVPRIDLEGAALVYRVEDPSFCAVDPLSGTLTALDVGVCVVTALFLKPGHEVRSISKTVNIIGREMGEARWGESFLEGLQVPDSLRLNPPGLEHPEGAEISYHSNDKCAVDERGVVTAVDNGICVVEATFSLKGYQSKTVSTSIEIIAGAMGAISWPASKQYPGGEFRVFDVRPLGEPPTISRPKGAAVSYKSMNAGVCSVDGLGTITGVGVGMCVVKATFSKRGYLDASMNAALAVSEPR